MGQVGTRPTGRRTCNSTDGVVSPDTAGASTGRVAVGRDDDANDSNDIADKVAEEHGSVDDASAGIVDDGDRDDQKKEVTTGDNSIRAGMFDNSLN